MLNDIPEPISVRQAAAILGCARSWVFHLVHTGKLSFKKQGKAWTLRRDEVEAMARSGWARVGVQGIRKEKVG